jgi:hypothetical protein
MQIFFGSDDGRFYSCGVKVTVEGSVEMMSKLGHLRRHGTLRMKTLHWHVLFLKTLFNCIVNGQMENSQRFRRVGLIAFHLQLFHHVWGLMMSKQPEEFPQLLRTKFELDWKHLRLQNIYTDVKKREKPLMGIQSRRTVVTRRVDLKVVLNFYDFFL